MRRALLLVVLLGLLTPTACKKPKGETSPPAGDAAGAVSVAPEAEAPTTNEPYIFVENLPLSLEGPIIIRFPRAFAPRTWVNKEIDDKTVVEITPRVDAEIVWATRDELQVRLDQPLRYGTEYGVALKQVKTRDGVLSPAADEVWHETFKTPPFELRHVDLERFDRRRATVRAMLTFTGPPNQKSLRERLRVRAGDEKFSGFTLKPQREANRVRLEVSSKRLLDVDELVVEVAQGVREAEGRAVWSEEGEWSLDLQVPGHLKISEVNINETASGFALIFSCEDEVEIARHEDRRWGYDMCPVEAEDVAEMVRVEPRVRVSAAKQRNGFRLMGDFRGGSYVVTIASGLTSRSGAVLTETFEETLQIPHRSPQISFTSQGRYLPRAMLSRVPISHINLARTQLTVREVHPQNLVFWLAGANESATAQTSDQVATLTVPLQGDTDVKTSSLLDLRQAIPGSPKGVFELRLHRPPKKEKPKEESADEEEEDPNDAEEDGYDGYDGEEGYGGYGRQQQDKTEAVARVVLTDLSIVAKRYGPDRDKLQVWVFDSTTLKPASGAKVELYSQSNRVLASASTDSAGGCSFPVIDDTYDAEPFAVVASRGDDLSFLEFSDLEIALGESDVLGLPYKLKQAYIASVYTDRGVYRPGETAHIVALLRSPEDEAPAAGLPVKAKMWDPRAKVAAQLRGKTNAAGMVAFDFEAASFAATGPYRVDVEVGGKTVTSHRFNVEEFVPERMKVSAKAAKAAYLAGEEATFEVDARYLFGPKAADQQVELACVLKPSTFSSAKFKDYTFNPWSEKQRAPVALETVSGTLDEEGKASLSCPGGGEVGSVTGPARVVALASVFEAGSGRTSVAQASAPMHPDTLYVGLRSDKDDVQVGQDLKIDGVLVDWEGELVKEAREVELRLMALEVEWNWESQVDDLGVRRHRWKRYFRPVMMDKTAVKAEGGRFSWHLKAPGGGSAYLVRARAGGGASADLQIESRYSWGYWGAPALSSDQTPKPQQPTGLLIDAPKQVEVGQVAKARFEAPYAGRALFTVETDELLEARWLEVKAGAMEVEFKVERFAPNVYVSVLLIKDPRQESAEAFLPGRAFGARPVKVAPTAHAFEVALSAPDEVRPNSPLKVTLQLSPGQGPAFATVAAVDEGILQLTKFKTPDVLADLFARRGLGVSTFETVGWTLLLPPSEAARSPGGDDEGGGKRGRVMPVKPVALWSGLVEVGADGKAEVSLDVPQYRGELRVMAVAASATRAGSAEASVTVRDPLVLQSTFPRFLVAADRFVVPVFLTNMTGKPGRFQVELTVGAGVTVEGEGARGVRIPAGESKVVTFVGRAKRSFGAARFAVKASGNGTTSRDEAEVPFLPSGPMFRETDMIGLEQGKNDLKRALAGWVPETETTTVWVTTNPYGRELGHLRYLVRYPYGCIEQTTSSTRPLLHIANLIESIDPEFVQKAGIEKKFMHGVKRLLSMQTASGGFAYWPGDSTPTYWGTAYATHLLLEGRDAGYPIPDDRLEDALRFMEQTLTSKTRDRDQRHGYSVASAEPYMQFVLAKAGRARKGRLRQLIKRPKNSWGQVTGENLYLLKAALHLAGDRSHEKALKRPFEGEIGEARANSWTYWSELRYRGLQLNIMEDLFKGSAAAEPLAQAIAGRLRANRHGYHYTTQELAWAISGLGKRAGQTPSSFGEVKLLADGKPRKRLPKPPGKKEREPTWSVDAASGFDRFELELDKAAGKVWAMVTVEGVKPDVPYDFGDETLRVRRTYRNGDGDRVDARDVDLGDVIHVELEISNQKNERIQNIALVDRFGAGLEIENPRLGREHVADWVDADQLWDVSYMNIRDDRIELFGHLGPKQSATIIYTTRAVTAGEFTTPPVRAEAMYEPRYWSCQPGEPLRVRNPWDAS